MKLRELLKKIRLQPGLSPLEGEGERPVDNIDGWASGTAAKAIDPSGGNIAPAYPPNYVPPVDEGRPRH
jgi:hypothetical protein